jgi:hypothetical protein
MLDFESSHTDRKVILPLLFSLMEKEAKKSRLLRKFLKSSKAKDTYPRDYAGINHLH